MAWIESHQELGRHPKTKRLARELGITLPQAVGHLHLLWWWALDFAQDGDLTPFAAIDIADAALWEGDPDVFLSALITSGFIDSDSGPVLHDWDDYAGRLIERRRADAERKKSLRSRSQPRSKKPTVTKDSSVQRTSDGRPADVQRNSTVPYPTQPNLTVPEGEVIPPSPPAGESAVESDLQWFELFWIAYPRKIGKKAAEAKFTAQVRKGVPGQELYTAAKHYAEACSGDEREERFVMHPETFLGHKDRWRDFLEPPKPEAGRRPARERRSSNVFLRRDKPPGNFDHIYRKFDGPPEGSDTS